MATTSEQRQCGGHRWLLRKLLLAIAPLHFAPTHALQMTRLVSLTTRQAARIGRSSLPLTMLSRRSRSREAAGLQMKRMLQRSECGVPEIARCYPERYELLLREKVAALERMLADAASEGAVSSEEALPPIEVFESPRSHFRMRANFAVWREGVDPDATRHFIMFNQGDKAPQEVVTYPMGSERLNTMMPQLLAAINEDEVLRSKVNDVRLLTTLTGDALVTITYHRPLDDEWLVAAAALATALDARIVGRSKGVKLVVGGETVAETLSVPGGRGACHYTQTEGAFTQPNAKVCEKMLGWAYDATHGSKTTDLCELYCGNGCFTVALAPNFRRVVATEISTASVELARRNLAANGLDNVRVARLSAEEFVEAYTGARGFRRLEEAGIKLGSGGGYELRTLFVDPPRAGLDETARRLAARFERVVYVSCNPETLARDVAHLADTHTVTRLAAFDQFPYTPHLECGVVLERAESAIDV